MGLIIGILYVTEDEFYLSICYSWPSLVLEINSYWSLLFHITYATVENPTSCEAGGYQWSCFVGKKPIVIYWQICLIYGNNIINDYTCFQSFLPVKIPWFVFRLICWKVIFKCYSKKVTVCSFTFIEIAKHDLLLAR